MVTAHVEQLPSKRVIEEGRQYLRAAKIIKTVALKGNIDLMWPAAMNTGLALELFLKAFHVEFDPNSPMDVDDPKFDNTWRRVREMVSPVPLLMVVYAFLVIV